MKIKLLRQNVKPPEKGTDGAAAYDIFASLESAITLYPNEILKVPTGFALAIPDSQVGLIFPRSGLGTKGILLANGTGVVDSDYRGEVLVALRNTSDTCFKIEPQMRIAQIMFTTVDSHVFERVNELPDTVRGSGGFGSSGV